ncbi:hypothetical protein K8I28_01080 [bacterium]|nr:hypothetical protein [bacterium]
MEELLPEGFQDELVCIGIGLHQGFEFFARNRHGVVLHDRSGDVITEAQPVVCNNA